MSLQVDKLPPRPSAADACADALRERILSGALPPGDRLPPERELAAAFGVNRLTLRNALGQLASAGLLHVRQGSGYVVQDFRRRGGPDLLPELFALAAADELRAAAADLLLVRRHLAGAVLERLAASDADTAPIREAIATYGALAVSDPTPAQMAEADIAVLTAVVESTGSAVLQLCLNPVSATLAALPALRDAIYADPVAAAAGYAILLAWLERKDASQIPLALAALAERDAETLARLPRATPSKRKKKDVRP